VSIHGPDYANEWHGIRNLITSAIPSFFEIKESGGVLTLSEKNRIVGFLSPRVDCKLERGKRT
jgi:hypothetical protein